MVKERHHAGHSLLPRYVNIDLASSHDFCKKRKRRHPLGIKQHKIKPRYLPDYVDKRLRIDHGNFYCGMDRPLILGHEHKLDDKFRLGRFVDELDKVRIIQAVTVVVGMEADAGRAELFHHLAEIVRPVRLFRVDGGKGEEQTCAGPACRDKSCVNGPKIPVKKRVKTSRPRLDHSVAAKFIHKPGKLVVLQFPKWPAREIHVYVDDAVRCLPRRPSNFRILLCGGAGRGS